MDKPLYPCIHYSELEPYAQTNPLCTEWETYRREIGKMIAEGHEGKFVLIKGSEIVGFFDTLRDAHRAGLERFGVDSSYLFREVRTYERIYKPGAIVGEFAKPVVTANNESKPSQTLLAKSA